MSSNIIAERLRRLPDSPGVYLMRSAEGNILYVGKAINLRQRVRSYFAAGQKLTPKIQQMVARVADIDFYTAASEQEALILELNLIKQYHPRYNVSLKDDKTFPYLKISTSEAWPRITTTRRLLADGGRYFGPFANARSVRHTLRVIQSIFPLRTCSKEIKGKAPRPCLEYHMGRCLAPCTGAADRREYAQVVKEVALFLEGRHEKVIRELRSRMSRASEAQNYEKAARLRDEIQAIGDVIEGQRIAAKVRGEQDVVAFAQDGDRAYVQLFQVRGNKITGRENFLLQGARQEEPSQIMAGFVKQFYASNPNIPPLLLLQYPVADAAVIAEWLRGRRGGAVEIRVPRRGSKKELLDAAADNARQGLEHFKIKEMVTTGVQEDGLAEIEKALGLAGPPRRMEAYDISNIQGKAAVGSMVVFEKGRPKPAHYRRFKIKTVAGADDYAMLREVLTRRFRHSESREGDKADTWALMPDLVLIDGGKGQLNAALAAVGEAGIDVPMIGLAKENEEIFLPHRRQPLVLPKSSAGLQLLQRLRDEAHRFAISYFSRVHRKQSFASALDAVPGIGPRRRRALLRQFGSLPRIREASVEELAAATGMTPAQAERIKEYL